MDAETVSARLALEAWREQCADRLDPVRFGFMVALESRMHGHVGEARRLLEHKLDALLQAYAADVAAMPRGTGDTAAMHAARTDTLASLITRLQQRPESTSGNNDLPPGDTRDAADAAALRETATDTATATAFAAPALLDEFRRLWDDVRTGSRLRHSPEEAPMDAGPLNSAALAHRTIARMRQLSPGYARHFLAYVETLGWLQRMPGAAPPHAVAGNGRKPPARRAPRRPS